MNKNYGLNKEREYAKERAKTYKGYKAPICISKQFCAADIDGKIESEVFAVAEKIGIEVDKDRLLEALNNDHHQYIRGFDNGFEEGFVASASDSYYRLMRIVSNVYLDFKTGSISDDIVARRFYEKIVDKIREALYESEVEDDT